MRSSISIPGSIGRVATFHSIKKNMINAQAPIVNMLMTSAEFHGKYEPPPEIGIRRKMIPIDEDRQPR